VPESNSESLKNELMIVNIKCHPKCIFLLSWLLLLVFTGDAQQVQLDGPKVFTINDQQARDKGLPISFGSPGNFKGDIFVTVASELDFNPGVPDIVGTGFTVLSKTVQTLGSGKKQLKVRFLFTQSSVTETNILSVNNIRFPLGSLCDTLQYKINVDLKDTVGTVLDKDSALYTVNKRIANIEAFLSDTVIHNCRDPFYTSFGVRNVYNASGPIRLTFKYNQTLFKLAGVTTGGVLPSSVTYTTDPLHPGEIYIDNLYGYNEFKAFLRPINCSSAINNQSFTNEAKLLETPTCPITSIATQTYEVINTDCCGDPGTGTPVPYIVNAYDERCAGECFQTLYVSVYNYTSTPFTNLIYDLNLVGGTPVITATDPTLGSFSGSTHTRTFSLDTGKVYSFSVTYKLTGTLPASITANETLRVTTPSAVTYDTKAFPIIYETTCNPGVIAQEWAVENGTAMSGGVFELQNGNPISNIPGYIVLERFRPFALSNFAFTYELNDYLKVNNTVPIKFAYVKMTVGFDPSTLTYATTNFHIDSAIISADKKKITFKGIDMLSTQCPTDSVLVIQYGLTSFSQLQVDTKFNDISKLNPFSNVLFGRSVLSWKASGLPKAEFHVKPSCDSLDFSNTGLSLNVTDNKPFYYSYVVNNSGAINISDIIMVGSIPHIGDKHIEDGTARNSTLTLPCPSDLSVYVQEDLNGVITTKKLALNTDYTLVFSNETGICKAELTNPSTSCVTVAGTCNGSNLYFKLKLKPTFGPLKGFSKLAVQMKMNVPPGTPTGLQGIASFAATYAANRIAEEATAGTVTVATTSPCTPKPPCIECANSFAPIPGKEYVLSAWVKEGSSPGALYYTHAGIILFFKGANSSQDQVLPIMKATGEIIDGWQRIEQVFKVPASAVKIGIKLVSNGSDAYFDDIRVHPFDANMKSFVYDPKTLRLTAELDERNYATFYEYNEEGALVRVKKETAKGVMTVKESRNASRKK
jgi:hypothetical protein